MEPGLQKQSTYHIRALAKPEPKTYRLMIDIADDQPAKELIYKDNKDPLFAAQDFVTEHGLSQDLVLSIMSFIDKNTGGRVGANFKTKYVSQPAVPPAPSDSLPSCVREMREEWEEEEGGKQGMGPLASGFQGLLAQEVKMTLPFPEHDPIVPGWRSGHPVSEPQAEAEATVTAWGPYQAVPAPQVTANGHKRRAVERLEPVVVAAPMDNVAQKHMARISKTVLQSEVRIGDLGTTMEKLDISKTAGGHEERIRALEGMVAKVVRENVRLGARLARAEGLLGEQEL